jgi:streptogramin lyase
MALVRELVYTFGSGVGCTTVLEMGGNLYAGTSGSIVPSEGVREVVDFTTPTSDSIYEDTDDIDDPEFVAVHDGALYVSQFDQANNVYRVDPGGISLHATWPTTNPWGLMFLPDGSLWTTGFTPDIGRFDPSGTYVADLTDAAFSVLGGGEYLGGFVYLPSVNSIVRVDTTTLDVVSFPMTVDTVGEDLCIANGRIYWTERNAAGGNYTIQSTTLDGSDQTTEYTNNDWEPIGITRIGGYLYVASADDPGRIFRFLVGGRKWWVGVAGWGG